MMEVRILLTLKYKNHLGETIDFGNKNYFTNSVGMRDYTWNYESDFNKIKSFNSSCITTKTLTVSIYTDNDTDKYSLFNSIFEIFEKDVLSKIPGKFYFGDYYYSGYVISSVKKEYMPSQNLLTLDLTIASDRNTWVYENLYTFTKNQPISGHGYAYKYPYRYSSSNLKTFFNTALIDSDFKLTIYGSCSNPVIYIGGHPYSVATEIENGEYLEVDSREKTIYKVQPDGAKTNAISYRDRDNYIFKKIPSGVVPISWNNDFGFDITIYDERSEPLWSA